MAGSQQTAAPSAGRPSYFGVVLYLALVQSSLVYGATPPSVEADGVSLSLKAGTDGDVVLVTDAGSVKASGILAMVPVVTDHTEALLDTVQSISTLSTDVQQIREEAIAKNSKFEGRLAALEQAVAALPKAFDPQALVEELQALNKAVNKLTKAVCTDQGAASDDDGSCTIALPSCSPKEAEATATDGSYEVDWPGDHGSNVPVGVVASFVCKSGYGFKDGAAPSAALSTCRADGWTGLPASAACGACTTERCATCTGGLDNCDTCSNGKPPTISAAAEAVDLDLDATMVSFDTERLRTGSNDKDTWQYNSAEDMKRCLISQTAYKNPRAYYKCPIFSVEGGADPVWIEFDLKKDYLIDHVILYQYYLDKRSYNGQGVAVSKTGEFTEADTRWLLKRANDESGPATTNRGLKVKGDKFEARYVRFYSGGSPKGLTGAHFLHVDVVATPHVDVEETCE